MITSQAPVVKRQKKVREMKITVAKGGFDFSDSEGGSINLLYDTLIQLIEQLKAYVEVAESRTLNRQKVA